MKKILVILTSNDKLGLSGQKTGLWLEELATPYYKLKEAGYELTLASPEGGEVPIDPSSLAEDAVTADVKKYQSDEEAQKALANTELLKNMNADDFDAVFYPGGHGLLWDLVEDTHSIELIEHFYKSRKPISFVCHGPAVLKNTSKKGGQPLVKGLKVTGFSNTEEKGVQLTDVVPFLLEDMLNNNEGNYSKAGDWEPYVVSDGLLITGQNPGSSSKVAEALISKLGS